MKKYYINGNTIINIPEYINCNLLQVIFTNNKFYQYIDMIEEKYSHYYKFYISKKIEEIINSKPREEDIKTVLQNTYCCNTKEELFEECKKNNSDIEKINSHLITYAKNIEIQEFYQSIYNRLNEIIISNTNYIFGIKERNE